MMSHVVLMCLLCVSCSCALMCLSWLDFGGLCWSYVSHGKVRI